MSNIGLRCALCKKTFSKQSNLNKHIRNVHKSRDFCETERKYICSECQKGFSTKFNLNKHIRLKHIVEKPRASSKIQCTQCPNRVSNYKELRHHTKYQHHIEMEKEEIHFTSMKDFQSWLGSIEKKNQTHFVKHSSCKVLADDMKKYYYYCHRTGYFTSKSEGKRRMKSQGSNKVNGACTSTIELTIKEDNCDVIYWKTHCGHSNSFRYLTMSHEDRVEIAGKIANGITLERIMDDIRDEVTDKLSTKHFITKTDLRNIKRDFNLYGGRHHQDDATSVHLWVEAMKKLGETANPVIFYKPQSSHVSSNFNKDDFLLILMTSFQKQMLTEFGVETVCIDSTHGTNSYDFELTTLLVIDEFGKGFPVAFCLSNRKDTYIKEFFFTCVCNEVGKIKSKVFMSDDDASFYNAWKLIMGPAEKQLLCTWHVDNNWRRSIRDKVRGTNEDKAFIYKCLRTILEAKDEAEFNRLKDEIINNLLTDPNTTDFANYFIKHYISRAQMWAYCYRHGAGINSNNYLESLHKIFKYFYLHGTKNKRLDSCLTALIKYCRDKIFDRLIRITKKRPTTKTSAIFTRHRASNAVPLTNISTIMENCAWEVVSSSNSEIVYTVQKNETSEHCKCERTCKECNICIHMYSCSCVDNLIKYNICKHIHACVRLNKTPDETSSQITAENTNNDVIPELLSVINCHNAITQQSCDLKSAIKNKINLLMGQIDSQDMTGEVLQTVNQKLDKLLQITQVDTSCTMRDTKNKEPTNKNIEQKRLFSTIKKRKRENKWSKPSSQETEFIKECLASNGTLNIHTGFDHDYC